MKLETLRTAQTSLFEPNDRLDKKTNLSERDRLYKKYSDKLVLNPGLSRATVSFQDNKVEPFYRWLKFKEGFSSKLVRYLLAQFGNEEKSLKVLDPFAGSGTTLTTSVQAGHSATGIELLPVGIAAMRARLIADSVDIHKFELQCERLKSLNLKEIAPGNYSFPHLRITKGAFNDETESAISRYMTFIDSIDDEFVHYLFWFACLSVLENVSYTRKDGQYLRWDYRSGRSLKSKYFKKIIPTFERGINEKIQIILNDLKKRNGEVLGEKVRIITGSCLDELANLPENYFDLVITSPPYCNRYDYTRTYALELAFLGFDEQDVKDLRQTLLSSTVENRDKKEHLDRKYRQLDKYELYRRILDSFRRQQALHEVLQILNHARENRALNNNNIPNMVESYFFEMNVVIHELCRVLATGGRVYMVNDNVQYMGEEVPVDLILSDFARRAGMQVECIWILPKGKGNSSQQMGQFGRNEIRKCVYVWTKAK